MTSLLGVLLALGLLIWLAYRGVSVLLLGPAMALLAAAFAVGTPLMVTYTQLFMQAAGSFIVQYFPLFLLGAIFGKLMDDSGAAEAIARFNAAYFLPILWRAWVRPLPAVWPDEQIARRGWAETTLLLLLPPLLTAVATLATGVFADIEMSPLAWAQLIAQREYQGVAQP